jgi:tetratricopeptide (TPR) repeat protein
MSAGKLAPADPAIYLDLAQTFAGERNWPEAERFYEGALRVNPRYTAALAQLSALWISQKQEAKALARVQDYLTLYPDDASGHYLMGELELNRKRYHEAEAELNRAAQLEPDMPAIYIQLGRLFQERGDLNAAIARYQKALDLKPKSLALNIMVGDLFQAKGDLAKATHYYETALTLDPDSGVAANNLAWVYALQNTKLDDALILARKANQLLPDAASVKDTLAWVYYKKNSYSSAVPLLEECVRQSPGHAMFHYHLGMTYLAEGGTARGKEELQAALQSGLSGDDAQQARKALTQTN